jgi:dTDP-4-amino-4,6-dideoxygalactose transaminase
LGKKEKEKKERKSITSTITSTSTIERLKVARELGETSLMLLVHPTLSRQNVKDTVEVVRRVVSVAAKQKKVISQRSPRDAKEIQEK